jgi:undecaprenyl-diphosphatase
MTKRISYGVAGLILLIAVFLLGLHVMDAAAGPLDTRIETALALRHGTNSDALISFWQAVSWIGGGKQRYIIVFALALLLGRWDRWQSGAALVITSIIANLVSDGLKDHFLRPRPDLVPHLDHVNSLSYPSGHATSAALVYLLFAALVPTAHRGRWLAGGALAALLTGLSRVSLGVHWPSDVLGGWMVGGAFTLFALAILNPSKQV